MLRYVCVGDVMDVVFSVCIVRRGAAVYGKCEYFMYAMRLTSLTGSFDDITVSICFNLMVMLSHRHYSQES